MNSDSATIGNPADSHFTRELLIAVCCVRIDSRFGQIVDGMMDISAGDKHEELDLKRGFALTWRGSLAQSLLQAPI